MKDGKFEAGDFAFAGIGKPEQLADYVNDLIPQLLEQLVGDGEGFTAEDFKYLHGPYLMRTPSDLAAQANAKLQAIRAKDKAEISSLRSEVERLRLHNHLDQIGANIREREYKLKALEKENTQLREQLEEAQIKYEDASAQVDYLTREREEAPMAYFSYWSNNRIGLLSAIEQPDSTHSARLRDIKPLAKEGE